VLSELFLLLSHLGLGAGYQYRGMSTELTRAGAYHTQLAVGFSEASRLAHRQELSPYHLKVFSGSDLQSNPSAQRLQLFAQRAALHAERMGVYSYRPVDAALLRHQVETANLEMRKSLGLAHRFGASHPELVTESHWLCARHNTANWSLLNLDHARDAFQLGHFNKRLYQVVRLASVVGLAFLPYLGSWLSKRFVGQSESTEPPFRLSSLLIGVGVSSISTRLIEGKPLKILAQLLQNKALQPLHMSLQMKGVEPARAVAAIGIGVLSWLTTQIAETFSTRGPNDLASTKVE
jgi:hypothetical protein